MAWEWAGIQLGHMLNPFSAHISSSRGCVALPGQPGASLVLRLSQEGPEMSTARQQCGGQVSQPPARGVDLCPLQAVGCPGGSGQAEQVSVLVGSCPVTFPSTQRAGRGWKNE